MKIWPAHEILALSLWQLPQLAALTDALELYILIMVRSFINSYTLCMQAAKDLASLLIYTRSPEPSFLDTAMSASTKVKCAGSYDLFFDLEVFIYIARFKIGKELIVCIFFQ